MLPLPSPPDHSIQRIYAIRWTWGLRTTPAQHLLFREYLRRNALWSMALDQPTIWPFGDLASIVAPAWRANREVTDVACYLASVQLSSMVDGVDVSDLGTTLPLLVQQTCCWAIHWAHVQSLQLHGSWNLPDPFDPLLSFYERGGLVRDLYNGWIRTHSTRYTATLSAWLDADPVTYDEMLLNTLDQQAAED